MTRLVKHFDLHQVSDTELRVVSDVEDGVLDVIQAEDAVVRSYMALGLWRHSWVDLFILQDLQTLAGQLGEAGGLPPGGSQALDMRPVVNAYDLADISGCHVFVNQKVMVKEGYWGDLAAMRALLAHEHSHPLSENETTRASRALRLRMAQPVATAAESTTSASGRQGSAIAGRLGALVALLAEKLCCYAPREIFANDLTIAGGFADDLHYLDRNVMAAAAKGVLARVDLVNHLKGEVDRGALPADVAAQLLLVGDLKGYVDLALETAPFYRMGRADEASQLEAVLFEGIFPRLEPQIEQVYRELRDLYVELTPDLSVLALASWGRRVLELLAGALRERGMEPGLSLDFSDEREDKHA
jgi:hypothetical protein